MAPPTGTLPPMDVSPAAIASGGARANKSSVPMAPAVPPMGFPPGAGSKVRLLSGDSWGRPFEDKNR